MQIDDFLSRLRNVHRGAGQWSACCPAHDDQHNSLSIAVSDDGKILIHCHAGCHHNAILSAMGLSESDLFPDKPKHGKTVIAEYLYPTTTPTKKVRYDDKSFQWFHLDNDQWKLSRKGIAPCLYTGHSNDISNVVMMVEGEKDVLTLQQAGFPAASLPDGANSKWRAEYTEQLRHKTLYILADNDKPGVVYAQHIAENMAGSAKEIYILDLSAVWPDIPEHGDVTDMFERLGAEKASIALAELTANPSPWQPEQMPETQPKSGPSPLKEISAYELQRASLPQPPWVVEKLIPAGLAELVAPPKYGKSWLALQLCIAVSTGQAFLGYGTNIGGCLYLALEDRQSRLQDRLNKQLAGQEAPKNFNFSTSSETLDSGFLWQLDEYITRHPDTKLIVVDVLEKVRQVARGKMNAYREDYANLIPLKDFADKHCICLLVVHHTRKMQDSSDPFNQISGSTGIMGTADTIIVLARESRSSPNTIMHVTGRDVEDQDKVITFDRDVCIWTMCGEASWLEKQQARQQYEDDPIVAVVRKILSQSADGIWINKSAQDIKEAAECYAPGQLNGMSSQAINKQIKSLIPMFASVDCIKVWQSTNGTGGARNNFRYLNNSPLIVELPTQQSDMSIAI